MNEELEYVRQVLRRALPPMPDDRPRRDLWPDVVDRMSVRRVAWFDWVVGALALAASLGLPAVVPTLLYLL